MDKITVGKFIAEQRKQLSLTQKQFAEQLGVTDKAVSRWETGKGYPDIETIEEIAKIFNVTINDVLSGKINKPEEKETAAEQNITDALREILRVKKNGIIRTIITALIFCFIIIIIIPALYFTLIPNLREGNYILHNDKHYGHISQLEIPSEFVFYAQESGVEGEVIGREGLGLIRKTDCEDIIYNYNTIGNNFVYALFKAEDIPSVKEARNYTVSMHYRGDTEKNTDVVISKDASKVMEVLDNAYQNTAVDYYSVDWNQFYCYQVCMDCKEFAGYYVIGYIYIGDGINYYRSCENMDICYEISLEQITE